MKTLEFTTYSHLASALINDDTSGLSDDDMILLDNIFTWLATNKAYCTATCSEESFFTWHPDFGTLGGDCLEYVALCRD